MSFPRVYKYNIVRVITEYTMRTSVIRPLVFLWDVAIFVEQYDAGVEVGSIRQPGAVRQEEVRGSSISGPVKYFLRI